MPRSLRASAVLAVGLAMMVSPGAPEGPARPDVSSSTPWSTPLRSEPGFGPLPLQFIPNEGQTDKAVAFYITGRDRNVFFTGAGLTFDFVGGASGGSATRAARRWAVKLDFVGISGEVRPSSLQRAGTVVSYFTGRLVDRPAGLAASSKIVYRELWPGIDLVYSGSGDRMKYEFIVRPGADPSRIAFRYRGAESVALTAEGRLAVRTPVGGIEDDAPIAYQETDGVRRSVPAAHALEAGLCGFDLGAYDGSRTLVIDPSSLFYSGFIGGAGADSGAGIALGADGSAYVVGTTASLETSFPAAAGPDLTYNGGDKDVFIAKVAPDGTGLVYCGYIGGDGVDEAAGVAVDSAGNAYVTGHTTSSEATFPVVVGPDLTYNGYRDVFVAKIDPAGTALLYCGFVGGATLDEAGGIAVDGVGGAYIVGTTGSDERTFPVKEGPDLVHGGPTFDAFVAKVDIAGTGLVYCGYIGGTYDDLGQSVAVDAAGCAYVSGTTISTELDGFPVRVGPELNFQGGLCDAYVAKVSASGSSLDYCGYIGRPGTDFGVAIAVDGTGSLYCVGNIYFDAEPPDVVFCKVNSAGTAISNVRGFGGTGDDRAGGIAVDGWGNVYIAGYTNSNTNTFPEIVGPGLVRKYSMDLYDPFVLKLDASGVGLPVYCGFIAGYGDDRAAGIAVDGTGSAYVVGTVGGGDWGFFPAIAGPGPTYGGGDSDAFVSRVLPVPTVSAPTLTSIEPATVLASNTPLTFTLRGTDFVPSAAAYWFGSPRRTRFISSTELECESGVYDLAEGRVTQIYLHNPDGQPAGPVTLTINSPVPRLDSLSPAVVPAGGGITGFRLLGANFLRSSIVRWNGAYLSEGWDGYVGMEAIDATIPPADLAAGGEFQVSVENPPPEGGMTASLTFRISTYTLECGSPSRTVEAGGSAVFPLLLTPRYGAFNAPVVLTCEGLPKGCVATFSPSSPTPGAVPLDIALSVRTTSRRGAAAATASGTSRALLPSLALLAVAGALFFRPRTPRSLRISGTRRWLAAAALLLLGFGAFGCGAGGTDGTDGDGTPPGTFHLTVRGTAGALDVSLPLTLVIR